MANAPTIAPFWRDTDHMTDQVQEGEVNLALLLGTPREAKNPLDFYASGIYALQQIFPERGSSAPQWFNRFFVLHWRCLRWHKRPYGYKSNRCQPKSFGRWRGSAAYAVGELGFADAIPGLKNLLADKEANVRSGAISALCDLRAISAADDGFEAAVRGYTADVARSYMSSIRLPPNYKFLSGAAVLPLPPIQVRHGKVFVLGAYPSAVFQSIRKRRVPVENLKMPFDATAYPGGVNASAEELDEFYLKPLGLTRKDCWITNLVKVFLFKKEHAEQFRVLGSTQTAYATRGEYERYAKAGLAWVDRELEIAEPRLIITLGSEVGGVFAGVSDADQRKELLNPYKIRTIRRGNHEYRVIHMVHPGQLMRQTPKWTKIHQQGIKSLRAAIRKLLEESP